MQRYIKVELPHVLLRNILNNVNRRERDREGERERERGRERGRERERVRESGKLEILNKRAFKYSKTSLYRTSRDRH